MSEITRSFPLEDIEIQRGGDGRTVKAYAAVFDVAAPVADRWGVYEETYHRSAFNKAISDAAPAGSRSSWGVGVFYNHGMTIHGTPSERGSMPLGTPIDITADNRGVLTVTRYNKTELADETLESIRSGAITGQSFTGRIIRSDRETPRGGFRRGADGVLPSVMRMEMGLKEYGPTPFPVFTTANVVAVRADMSDADKALLNMLLVQLAASDAALDPIVEAICAADGALDQAQAVIAQILAVPNPDPEDAEMAMNSVALTSLATRLDAAIVARASGTPFGAAADEPPIGHSGRSPWTSVRTQLRLKGITT
jgi:phage head maturation protease